MARDRDIDAVLAAYVECALWASYDAAEEEPGQPLDSWATAEDIAPTTLAEMREDIAAMIEEAATIEGSDWWTDEQFGHDCWLTRNGHGAGFWDRGQGAAGDALTAMTRPYGGCDLYVGNDGQIYV